MRADTVCGLPVHHIAWASIAMLLTGCASPYVATDRSIARQQLKPEGLGEAIAHARSRSLVYRDKVVELGESERLLSNGLLTFGAARGARTREHGVGRDVGRDLGLVK